MRLVDYSDSSDGGESESEWDSFGELPSDSDESGVMSIRSPESPPASPPRTSAPTSPVSSSSSGSPATAAGIRSSTLRPTWAQASGAGDGSPDVKETFVVEKQTVADPTSGSKTVRVSTSFHVETKHHRGANSMTGSISPGERSDSENNPDHNGRAAPMFHFGQDPFRSWVSQGGREDGKTSGGVESVGDPDRLRSAFDTSFFKRKSSRVNSVEHMNGDGQDDASGNGGTSPMETSDDADTNDDSSGTSTNVFGGMPSHGQPRRSEEAMGSSFDRRQSFQGSFSGDSRDASTHTSHGRYQHAPFQRHRSTSSMFARIRGMGIGDKSVAQGGNPTQSAFGAPTDEQKPLFGGVQASASVDGASRPAPAFVFGASAHQSPFSFGTGVPASDADEGMTKSSTTTKFANRARRGKTTSGGAIPRQAFGDKEPSNASHAQTTNAFFSSSVHTQARSVGDPSSRGDHGKRVGRSGEKVSFVPNSSATRANPTFTFGSPSLNPSFGQQSAQSAIPPPPRVSLARAFEEMNNGASPSAAFSTGTPEPAAQSSRTRAGRRRKLNSPSPAANADATASTSSARVNNMGSSAPAFSFASMNQDGRTFRSFSSINRPWSREASSVPPTAPGTDSEDDAHSTFPVTPSRSKVPSTFVFGKPEVASAGIPAHKSTMFNWTNAFGAGKPSPASVERPHSTAFVFGKSAAAPVQSPAATPSRPVVEKLKSTFGEFKIGVADSQRKHSRSRSKPGMFSNRNASETKPSEPGPSGSPFGLNATSSSPSRTDRDARNLSHSPPADPFVMPVYRSRKPPSPRSTTTEQRSDRQQMKQQSSNEASQASNPLPSSAGVDVSGRRILRAAPARAAAASTEYKVSHRRILRAGSRRDSLSSNTGPNNRNGRPDEVNRTRQTSFAALVDQDDAEMASDDDENDWEELKRRGNESYKSAQYADASEYYRQSAEALESHLERYPDIKTADLLNDKAKLHANRAASLMMLMQIGDAQRECRSSIDADPSYTRAYLRLGRIQVLLGDIAQAKHSLATAKNLIEVKRQQTNTDSRRRRDDTDSNDHASILKMEASINKLAALQGEIKWCVDVGDLRQALTHTDAALGLAPNCRALQVKKAQILLDQKNYDRIGRYCSDLLKKQHSMGHGVDGGANGVLFDVAPIGIELGLMWATALHYQDSVDEAMKVLSSLEAAAPCSAKVVQLKRLWTDMKDAKHQANELFKQGAYKRAIPLYSQALCLDPKHDQYCSVIYCNRAAAMMSLERYHTAMMDCDEALQRRPNFPRALLRRARCCVALKKFAEAIADFNRYLRALGRDASPQVVADIEIERNAAMAAMTKAAEEKRRSDAAKRHAEQEQRHQSDQRRYGWKNSTFYEEFRRGSTFGSRPAGPTPNSRGNNNTRHRASFMQKKPQRRTHYDVLNVEKSATAAEIKKAYRKLALIYHPDKSNAESHADLFKEMTAAYTVLSDATARAKYDRELIYNRFGNFYES